jgi:hypothetical protein
LLVPYFSGLFRAQSDFGRSSRYASLDAIDSDPSKTRLVTRIAAMRAASSLLFRLT